MSFDCEVPEMYNEVRIRARKAHRCRECNYPVRVGVVYVRCSFKIDGAFYVERQHVECRDFAAKVNDEEFDECTIPFGGVNEAIVGNEFDIEEPQLTQYRAEWQTIKQIHAAPTEPAKGE